MEQPQLKLSREALDRPTRAGLNALIRDLFPNWRSLDIPEHRAWREADEEYDRLREEFENSTKMRALRAKVERLRKIDNDRQDATRRKARYVRNLYHYQGYTKKVATLLSDLVDEINGVGNGKKGNRRRKGRKAQ
jgi:hypothetical protein